MRVSLVAVVVLAALLRRYGAVATTGSTAASSSMSTAALAEEGQGETPVPSEEYGEAGSAKAVYFGFERRPDLLDRVGGSESNAKSKFAVIYVHATELLINGAGFPGAFTTFIESALKNQHSSQYQKIAVILGGCGGDSMKIRKAELVSKRVLREIVENFREGTSEGKGGLLFVSSFHKDSDKNLNSDLKKFFEDSSKDSAMSPPRLSFAYMRNMPTGSGGVIGGQNPSVHEINSMRKYVNVVDHFVNTFVSALYSGDEEVRKVLKVADIIAALEVASTSISTLGKNLGGSGGGGKVAATSLAMIKYRVWSVVHPIYRKSIDSLYSDALMQFERECKKVPANSMLTKNLKKKASECVQTFSTDAKALRKDYAAALSRADSVYGGGGGGGNSRIPPTQWNSMDFSTDVVRLGGDLAMKCTDKVKTLWLQGLHNPYVRDAPWAPTHINFNYLIDPKAIVFDSQYDQLYDAQEEKILINRADGISLPGLAKVVFDPNKHPVPLEDKPWWVTLKEFYFSD